MFNDFFTFPSCLHYMLIVVIQVYLQRKANTSVFRRIFSFINHGYFAKVFTVPTITPTYDCFTSTYRHFLIRAVRHWDLPASTSTWWFFCVELVDIAAFDAIFSTFCHTAKICFGFTRRRSSSSCKRNYEEYGLTLLRMRSVTRISQMSTGSNKRICEHKTEQIYTFLRNCSAHQPFVMETAGFEGFFVIYFAKEAYLLFL